MPEKRITSRRSSARSSKKSSITSLSGKRSSVASTLEKKFLPPPRAVLDQEIQEIVIAEYEGDRLPSGVITGHGRAVFTNGHAYQGEWVSGQMHGQGALYFQDGIAYEGDFVENSISGYGVYRWPGAIYEGEVKNGLRHGIGRFSVPEKGLQYDGEWRCGNRHGKGALRFLYQDGSEMTYEGDWTKDKKHGNGRLEYPSGNFYMGSFVEDRKEGRGTMHWKDRMERYYGEWKADKPNGTGVHVWFHGDAHQTKTENHHAVFVMYNRYEGMFQDGHRNGEGVLYYATGARYEGEWLNDMKHGDGIFIYEDGSEAHCTFQDNRPVLQDIDKFRGRDHGRINTHIDDLLREEKNVEAARRAVNNVLMCHNTELRNVYDKYCQVTSPYLTEMERVSFTMLLCQFWELARHAKVPCEQIPLKRINEEIYRSQLPSPLVAWRHKKVLETDNCAGLPKSERLLHDPNNEILFTQFCEAIVRIAQVKYLHLDRIEERVGSMISKDVVPLLAQRKASQEGFHGPLSQDNRACLAKHEPVFKAIFCKLSIANNIFGLSNQEYPVTETASMSPFKAHSTHRTVLKLFHDIGLISNHLTAFHVIQSCNKACFPGATWLPPDTDSKKENDPYAIPSVDLFTLDTDLTYPEFVETMICIWNHATGEKHRSSSFSTSLQVFLSGKNGLLTKMLSFFEISVPAPVDQDPCQDTLV